MLPGHGATGNRIPLLARTPESFHPLECTQAVSDLFDHAEGVLENVPECVVFEYVSGCIEARLDAHRFGEHSISDARVGNLTPELPHSLGALTLLVAWFPVDRQGELNSLMGEGLSRRRDDLAQGLGTTATSTSFLREHAQRLTNKRSNPHLVHRGDRERSGGVVVGAHATDPAFRSLLSRRNSGPSRTRTRCSPTRAGGTHGRRRDRTHARAAWRRVSARVTRPDGL